MTPRFFLVSCTLLGAVGFSILFCEMIAQMITQTVELTPETRVGRPCKAKPEAD